MRTRQRLSGMHISVKHQCMGGAYSLRNSGQNWPNRKWNEPREILSLFEFLVCFQKPVSTTGVPVGKLRKSRWRPKCRAANFLTSTFFVQYLRAIHRFLGFWT